MFSQKIFMKLYILIKINEEGCWVNEYTLLLSVIALKQSNIWDDIVWDYDVE